LEAASIVEVVRFALRAERKDPRCFFGEREAANGSVSSGQVQYHSPGTLVDAA